MKRALLVGAVLSLSIVLVTAADAAFPGSNGKIVFRAGGNLYVMQPNGSGLTLITPTRGGDNSPVWSPDGTKIAFVRIVIKHGIHGFLAEENADGSGRTVIMPLWPVGYPVLESTVAWSGNGKSLAFSAPPRTRPNSGSTHIFTVHVDGTHLRNLTKNLRRPDSEPDWSPDRSKIAFVEGTRSGTSIKTMSPDGSSQKTVVHGSVNGSPNWSPDGTQIVFARVNKRSGRTDICIVNADGTGLKNLTNTSTRWEFLPVFSPNGAKILFSRGQRRNSSAFNDLWTMNIDGTSPTRVTNTDVINELDADWQPI